MSLPELFVTEGLAEGIELFDLVFTVLSEAAEFVFLVVVTLPLLEL